MAAAARSAFPSVSSLSSSSTTTRARGPICSNFVTPNFVSKIKPSRLRISRKIGIVQNHVFRAPIACCLDDDRFEATSESAPASSTDDLMECAGCLQHHKLIDNLGLVVEYDFREENGLDSNADQV